MKLYLYPLFVLIFFFPESSVLCTGNTYNAQHRKVWLTIQSREEGFRTVILKEGEKD